MEIMYSNFWPQFYCPECGALIVFERPCPICELKADLAELKARMDAPATEPEPTSQPIDDPRKDYSWIPQEHERFEGDAFRNSDGAWIRLYNAGQATREDAANCAIEHWQGVMGAGYVDKIEAAREWRDAR